MNITTIKKSGITQVTTKRECQFTSYGNPPLLGINPKQGDYYHPRTDNPAFIIPAGTVLKILSIVGRTINVSDLSGRTFRIETRNIGKIC